MLTFMRKCVRSWKAGSEEAPRDSLGISSWALATRVYVSMAEIQLSIASVRDIYLVNLGDTVVGKIRNLPRNLLQDRSRSSI